MANSSRSAKAVKTSFPQSSSPIDSAAPTVTPSRFEKLIDKLKHVKGAIVAIAGVGAVASGLVGYYTTYKTVANTKAISSPSASAIKVGINSNAIAVLPFVNMSEDKANEYFSDGLSEELLNLLAQVPQLKVIARTSSFSFKGKEVDVATIAKTLNVGNVLEGSVRKSGNTLRITAQLIRTSDSTHLWSQTYDRQMTDVFTVQDEIANAVVAELKIKLLPEQAIAHQASQSTKPEAYTQYLLGRNFNHLGNLASRKLAKAALQQAVALAPEYAPAYAELANAEYFIAENETSAAAIKAGLAQALIWAEQAIRLAPSLADGYRVRGFLRQGAVDISGAVADYRQAIKLNAGDSDNQRLYASWLSYQGQFEAALAAAQQAVALDPLSADALQILGLVQYEHGEYAAAQRPLNSALQLAPTHVLARNNLGMSYLLQGNTAQARQTFEAQGEAFWRSYGLALVAHSQGKKTEADTSLAALIKSDGDSSAYQIATIYAWSGQHEPALAWLQRAYAQQDGGLISVKIDPLLKNLHGDVRYEALVKKLGL